MRGITFVMPALGRFSQQHRLLYCPESVPAKLTAGGLPTPAGVAVWTAATVAGMKARLAA
jgi:hypothetical protein